MQEEKNDCGHSLKGESGHCRLGRPTIKILGNVGVSDHVTLFLAADLCVAGQSQLRKFIVQLLVEKLNSGFFEIHSAHLRYPQYFFSFNAKRRAQFAPDGRLPMLH